MTTDKTKAAQHSAFKQYLKEYQYAHPVQDRIHFERGFMAGADYQKSLTTQADDDAREAVDYEDKLFFSRMIIEQERLANRRNIGGPLKADEIMFTVPREVYENLIALSLKYARRAALHTPSVPQEVVDALEWYASKEAYKDTLVFCTKESGDHTTEMQPIIMADRGRRAKKALAMLQQKGGE